MCVCVSCLELKMGENISYMMKRSEIIVESLHIHIVFIHAYTRYIVLISFVPKCEPPVRKVLKFEVRKVQLQERNEQCRNLFFDRFRLVVRPNNWIVLLDNAFLPPLQNATCGFR